MTTARASVGAAEDPRRRKLLEAALSVFTRYGFRKTSMDEVARAAQLSRQGLYLSFATKEELFRASVQYFLETALAAARARLGDASLPIEARLVGGFDEWIGRYVGMVGADASDLTQAGHDLVGPAVAEHEELFALAVARVLRASGVMAAYKRAGLTARQLADTLHATARGLKQGCRTRAAFVDAFTIAVRALCAPLREEP